MFKKSLLIILIFIFIIFCFQYFTKESNETSELIDFSNNKNTDYDLLRKNSSQLTTWGVKSLGIEKLQIQNKSKIKVGIIDSGINVEHEDLKGKIVKEYNAINPELPVYDNYGHGTAVAGIISANNNDLGIRGIASNVEIYSAKFLDEHGKGKIDSLVNAIEWCIDNGVQIINISFGMTSDNPKLRASITKALDSGIIIVAAAGNNFGMATEYPAAYEGVISVTAVNQNYQVNKQYSSTGKIDFALPGVGILTTTKDGDYAEYNGTSLAAAHMTGIISLILNNSEHFDINAKDQNLNEQIYTLLKSKAINLGNKDTYGNGFIKLY